MLSCCLTTFTSQQCCSAKFASNTDTAVFFGTEGQVKSYQNHTWPLRFLQALTRSCDTHDHSGASNIMLPSVLLSCADGDVEALLDFDQQDLLPTITGEDGSVLLPKGPRWHQPRRRSSLVNNPLAMQLASALEMKSRNGTGAEQYSPPEASAYGSALVSELRQDDESFFSDKSELEAEAPTLAAALGARRSSLQMPTPSNPSASESVYSMRRKPISRHVSHLGYGQPGKVLSRLRRSSNGDDEMFPVKIRRRSDEPTLVFEGMRGPLAHSSLA